MTMYCGSENKFLFQNLGNSALEWSTSLCSPPIPQSTACTFLILSAKVLCQWFIYSLRIAYIIFLSYYFPSPTHLTTYPILHIFSTKQKRPNKTKQSKITNNRCWVFQAVVGQYSWAWGLPWVFDIFIITPLKIKFIFPFPSSYQLRLLSQLGLEFCLLPKVYRTRKQEFKLGIYLIS